MTAAQKTLVSRCLAVLKKTTRPLALAITLAGTTAISTAQTAPPVVTVVTPVVRVWVEPQFEMRESRMWVNPVYQIVPGRDEYVPPVFQTVADRVWVNPVVRVFQERVLVPAAVVEQNGEPMLVTAHFILRDRTAVITAGHFDIVARQELVTAGHWQHGPDVQMLSSAGHFAVRMDRVLVSPGHFEDRPATPVAFIH